MKTAVYMRVSTDKQSTEAQEREISLFLASKEIKDPIIYKDEDESGKTASRPALNMLLDDCKQGKVKTLIVWKMDRLFRSLAHLITHLEQFQKQGVIFISIKENIDLSTPVGILMMQILGAFSQYEREMIVMRVKSGLANAKAKGIKLGPKYKIQKEIRTQIIELKNTGNTYKEISQKFGIKISTIQKIVEKAKVLNFIAE